MKWSVHQLRVKDWEGEGQIKGLRGQQKTGGGVGEGTFSPGAERDVSVVF